MTRLGVAVAIALVLVLAAPGQANANTTGCGVTSVRPQRTTLRVSVRVSNTSCSTALKAIRSYLARLSKQNPYRSIPSLYVYGYRISPIRYRDHLAFHGRRPGHNFYFRILEEPSPPEPLLLDLVRAIPVNRALGSFRIVAIELYTDGVIVRYGRRGPIHLPPSLNLTPEVTGLRDDVGTRYEGGGGGYSATERVLRGEAEFTPAIPTAATRLTVVTTRGAVEIPLS